MTKWISIKDKLPKHGDRITVCNIQGRQYICIFLERDKVNKAMNNHGFPGMQENAFCSQEIPGNILVHVTHWKKLDKSPEGI